MCCCLVESPVSPDFTARPSRVDRRCTGANNSRPNRGQYRVNSSSVPEDPYARSSLVPVSSGLVEVKVDAGK